MLAAIAAGVLVGIFAPELAKKAQPISDGFIWLIKQFTYPLIFLTITLGIASMQDLGSVGKIGLKALIYFEVVTTFALIIGIVIGYLLQPGYAIEPLKETVDVSKYVNKTGDLTLVHFLQTNATLQILIAAIIAGFAIHWLPGRKVILEKLSMGSQVMFTLLKYVMWFAPLGAFAGMATTIGTHGIKVLLPLAKLMLTVYCTMGIFIFVVLFALLRYHNISLIRFLNYIRDELLLVLGTSSSESALPALMVKLEKMGCSKPVVGLVIPTGYSFNLDGTTIYLSMAVIFLAQVYQVQLTVSQITTIILVLMVTSKGAAGVTGSGFVVLASTLSVVRVIPLEGIALLLGVDRFMSEARSITNFIGNGVATIFLANTERQFDRSKMEIAFAGETGVSPENPS